MKLLPAKTFDVVVVDHPHGLHEGIANGRPDKGETLTLQFFAHPI
jgi:hypothetical protein